MAAISRRNLVVAMVLGLLLTMAFAVGSAGAAGADPPTFGVKKHLTVTSQTDWTWTIEKTASQSSLTLAPGETFSVDYTVKVTPSSVTTWTANGTMVLVNNQTDNDIVVQSISDTLDNGAAATVTCPGGFPLTVPPGGVGTSVECAFSASGSGTPPTTNENVAIESDSQVAPLVILVDVTINPPVVTDECIVVTDDQYGSLGTVCAGDGAKTFTYSLTVGAYQTCGDYTYTNIASFVTNDTGTTGSATANVAVNVPCAGGCTLTQGYWKTHSELGPAPYDDTWAQLPNGASTPFYYSGKTWHGVFTTPPAGGNAYYQLAHQYMAARLNVLNGAATTPAVDAAMAGALAYFNNSTHTGNPAPSGATRTQLRGWASTLDDYNNGLIGPGHCSE